MLIKKNKCSACIASNVCDLKKCIVAVNRLKFNINRKLKKLQTDALFINSLNPIYYIPSIIFSNLSSYVYNIFIIL